MKQIFDTHAHYFDKRFENETEGGADAVLRVLFEGEIAGIINVATNPQNAIACIGQAKRYPLMFSAVGIHPEDCHVIADADGALASIESLLDTPEKRREHKIVALGEIGLDYHYENYGEIPMDKAREAYFFDRQMELAEKYGLPVIIHDREAHGDCFDTVLRYPNVRGVFHSYSGSPEMAGELSRRGWYLSFSGTLTFRNAERVRRAALSVPREQLLIETDAPYLAPHPHRGKLNHSGYLSYTLEVLGSLWDCTPEAAAEQTLRNAKRLFLRENL
ncbi:MAG: TatD family hydrolase [Clostridia bacterium]|nr:TatD family hydrolase [Clostridia bacterium]